MGIVEDLKKTNKGQLQYTRRQGFSEEVYEPPKLYIYHKEGPSSPRDDKSGLCLPPPPEEKGDNCKSFGKEDVGVVKTAITKEARDDDGKTTDGRGSIRMTRSPPVSPEYTRSSLDIRNYEIHWDNKARSAIEAKASEFADNDLALQAMLERRAEELEVKQQQEMQRLSEQTAKLHLREKAETSKRLQKMRDSHQTRKQLQDDKLLEGELKKQQLQEEERRRTEHERRQVIMHQSFAMITQTSNKLSAAHQACRFKNLIPEAGAKANQVVAQILTKGENMMRKSELTPEDVQGMASLLEYARNTFDFLMAHIEDATKTGMAEESEKAKQLQLQEQEKAVAAAKIQAGGDSTVQGQVAGKTSVDLVLSILDDVVTMYEKYRRKLDETRAALAPFVGNPQMKKYRFELQKAVNMPINSIAPVDGTNLRDKLQKLTRLIGGHQIDGKHVTAKDAPEGTTFCKNLIARMLVKKGEEQVSSKHESAFAIAMVTVGLWSEYADLGDLLIAHFYDFCPYVVPIYLPHDSSMSTQDYHRLLGYKVSDDGTIEPQDKFLKRMSGIMRLYAAILVSSPPRANSTHPHGIEHAWIWLSRVLNMDPQPDITATLTYDMVQVAGHALFSTYKVQFVKLLFMLLKDFLPKLRSVAVAGGPVPRLELFLQQTLKNFKMKQSMSAPDGYLSQNFWFT